MECIWDMYDADEVYKIECPHGVAAYIEKTVPLTIDESSFRICLLCMVSRIRIKIDLGPREVR